MNKKIMICAMFALALLTGPTRSRKEKRMSRIVKIILLLGCSCVAQVQEGISQPSPQISDEWNFVEARQFDFWLGEWEVNLRMRQSDNSWQNSVRAQTKIYSILDGKAILELWNSGSIKGYSLRYYDKKKDKWVLWLNWPQPNASASSTLEGQFRHGRAEFFERIKDEERPWFMKLIGRRPVSCYTFSDITANSLRWDDAYSTDGGESWKHSWIMEFSRTAELASWPEYGTQAHTYESGGLCDIPEFERFTTLVGNWSGKVQVPGAGNAWSSSAASMTGYHVLDGCAVMTFLAFEHDGQTVKRFSFKTFNTERDEFEFTVLDNQKGSGAWLFYGSAEGQTTHLVTDGTGNRHCKFIWRIQSPDHVSYERFESTPGSTRWQKVEIGTFERAADMGPKN